MKILKKLKAIISEIMDLEPEDITEESYLIRDLDFESIDLLELSVSIGSEFDLDVSDETIFLKSLRRYLLTSKNNIESKMEVLKQNYPHIQEYRFKEILDDINNGPVLKVKDLISYISYVQQNP